MARTARSVISPYEAETRAQAELARLGVRLGLLTKWKMKPLTADGLSMGYERPWHKRGPKRDGKHRSHTCSRTGGGNNNRRGGN